jgi:hypothetical protein
MVPRTVGRITIRGDANPLSRASNPRQDLNRKRRAAAGNDRRHSGQPNRLSSSRRSCAFVYRRTSAKIQEFGDRSGIARPKTEDVLRIVRVLTVRAGDWRFKSSRPDHFSRVTRQPTWLTSTSTTRSQTGLGTHRFSLRFGLGHLGHRGFGQQQHARNGDGIFQRKANNLRRVDDARFDEVNVLPCCGKLSASPAKIRDVTNWFYPRDGRTDWHRVAKRLDYAPCLARIGVPSLILCGRHDPQFPPTCSEELAREIHGAELVFFERSGHYPFIEEPEAFWSAVASFLTAPRATNKQVSEAIRQ